MYGMQEVSLQAGALRASATGTGPERAVRRATADCQVDYRRCGHVGRMSMSGDRTAMLLGGHHLG